MDEQYMSAETGRLQAADTARAVRISTGSADLDGELIVPANPHGLVIFADDDGNNQYLARNQFVAGLLRKAGLGTLFLDLLTTEEESSDLEGGHLRLNIGLLTQRLVCAAHWVAGEDEARHLRLGYFGSGTGGAAALVAAADLGRGIGGVVLSGARPDLAGNALLRIKSPTLLVVAERDLDLLEFNEEAFDMLACPKEFSTIPGATPGFEEPGALEQVARLASDWFLEHLRPFAGSRFTR
jgi:dienelactone hydrolase